MSLSESESGSGSESPARTLLCLCTGNTCRSPMLEALLRAELSAGGAHHISVRSAGVAAGAGQSASANAITAMRDRGLDITDHHATPLAAINPTDIAEVWCMSQTHAAMAIASGYPPEHVHVVAAAHGGVPDPYGGDLAEYRATATVLSSAAAAIAAGQPDQTEL